MSITTTNAKLIEQCIENKQKQTNDKVRVRFDGKDDALNVYRIPIKYLIYNIRNGRFRAELLEKEEELGYELNPNDKKDSGIIQKLLLEQDKNETKFLKDDIKEHGQIEPGIITFDGAVINANRRMAILTELFNETHNTKFSYLKVGRLPKGVDQQDIWRIEAGLQFGKDFRLKYGGINELLKLKEGKNQNLSSEDISEALLGRYSNKEVDEKLEILKLVEEYLIFIGKKGEYHLIHDDGKLEHFISAYKSIEPIKKIDKLKAVNLTTMIFLNIYKTKIRHLDIRETKKIVNNKEAYKEFMRDFSSSNPFKLKPDKLVENFTTAIDIVKAHEQKDKPEKLLRKALSLVESVNVKSLRTKKTDIKEILNQLEKRLNLLQRILK